MDHHATTGHGPARDLAEVAFGADFLAGLPVDDGGDPSPRQLPGVVASRVAPTPVAAPRLIGWSDELAAELGLARPPAGSRALDILAGNALAPGMRPWSARYGGHQFGNWAGQLGDGRAITLGEMQGPDGRLHELQLKGAGLTPYSRFADGRAVLRSSLREFLCSEAMHALGVPTTRALSLVGTGEPVVRDMFYDGDARPEPGAIVCRVAPTFLRFGNFEIHAATDEHGLLGALFERTLRRFFPHIDPLAPEAPVAWLGEVAERTALMVAHWMRVGFVHGVMNTDNMSVLGLTIDYGPYGFLEGYDPAWTPNTTDAQGRRYCYGRQPQIALWNLARLAGALRPLGADDDGLQRALERYRDAFARHHREMLAAKLGLLALEDADEPLLAELFALLAAAETDMPILFRGLSGLPAGDLHMLLRAALYDERALDAALTARWQAWVERWLARAAREQQPPAWRIARMEAANPRYLPRNYLAQQAIDAATAGDDAPLRELLAVLRRPYEEQPGHEPYAARRPEWARHKPGCSALSCSS
ncbi:MAG: YdiU family protein [Gammaproteobacteria bacterium]|nr:YdiU family protein [Gammaproteobacteria bacterium]